MKVCPACARQYADDQLFCKEDGMTLQLLANVPNVLLPTERKLGLWGVACLGFILIVGLVIWLVIPKSASKDDAESHGSAPLTMLRQPDSATSSSTRLPAKPSVEQPAASPAPAPEARGGDYPGERFPQTRQRSLSKSEVAQMGYSDTRYAVNEIYARHGYAFKNPSIRRRFSSFSWYRPAEGMSMEEIERNRPESTGA